MGENFEKLDAWYECIKSDKDLSIKEAKELLSRIKNAKGSRKDSLREELILGTIDEVYSYIKTSGILALADTGYYDVDDIIDSFVTTWIESLEKVESIGSFKGMFDKKFLKEVAIKLGIEEVDCYFGVCVDGISSLFTQYYNEKHNGNNPDLLSLYNSVRFKGSFSETKYNNITRFLESVYALYDQYDYQLDCNDAALGFMGRAFSKIVMQQRGDFASFDDTDDYGLLEVERSEVRETIFNSLKLNDDHKKVLYYRYGFDGDGEMLLHEVGELLGINYENVRNLESRALMNLRVDGKVLRLRDYRR